MTAPSLTPVRPEGLAPDEPILWQGRPSWRVLAVEALHIRLVALYFAALAGWRVASGLYDGEAPAAALLAAAASLPAALLAVGLLVGFAALAARTTRYTITPRRVILEIGVALSMTLNIPFRIVGGAGLRIRRDGAGDIPLTLTGDGRVSYVTLWPHARPWRLSRPEPMLRAVPDAGHVAAILAAALVEARPEVAPEMVRPARGTPVRPTTEVRPVGAPARAAAA